MHSRISGLSDYFATDELDCIRIGRQIVSDLNWRKLGPAPTQPGRRAAATTRTSCSASRRATCACRSTRVRCIARIVDGSRFDEYKAHYGTSLGHGWASIHGYPVGILANARGVLFNEEAKKATEFILLANQIDTPLVFLQNTTGYMVGKDYEQRGMIKDGAKMINAVTNCTVPHFTVIMGASYGAGNYGMCGRAYNPRFLFTWPNAKIAVMGPPQLAGVMSIVGRESAASHGREFDEEADDEAASGDRGADRARVARLLHQRQGVRRRHHRPARHPHRARHRAVRRAQQRRRGPQGLRRVPDVGARRSMATLAHACSSPTAARSRAASCAPRGRWASPPSRCSPTPTPTCPFVREADEAVRLPGLDRRRDTYLRVDRSIAAAPRHRRRRGASRLRLPVGERGRSPRRAPTPG